MRLAAAIVVAVLAMTGCGGEGQMADVAGSGCDDADQVATQVPTSTDPIEAAHEYLGQQDPAVEGQDPDYAPWFGGAWGVPNDPGVVVVAVTDLCLVDRTELEEVVGQGRLRLIEVPLGFDELNAVRSDLRDRLDDVGIEAELPIDSTTEGRIIVVVTPQPDEVPDEVFSGIPDSVLTIRQGQLDTPN